MMKIIDRKQTLCKASLVFDSSIRDSEERFEPEKINDENIR